MGGMWLIDDLLCQLKYKWKECDSGALIKYSILIMEGMQLPEFVMSMSHDEKL